MQANPRTIDDLFNAQSRYIVPMFQRLYVWNEDPQWKTLWEDIVEKACLQLDEVKTNAHYLGALIIEGVKPTSSREVKRLLVIDGQQRLTTLQLMSDAVHFTERDIIGLFFGLEEIYYRAGRFRPDGQPDSPNSRWSMWEIRVHRSIFVLCAGRFQSAETTPGAPMDNPCNLHYMCNHNAGDVA